jgi:hypothetical protein
MEAGNTMYYTNFSLKLLEDALYELSAAKLDLNDRTFVIKTGEHKRNLTLLPVSYSNVA